MCGSTILLVFRYIYVVKWGQQAPKWDKVHGNPAPCPRRFYVDHPTPFPGLIHTFWSPSMTPPPLPQDSPSPPPLSPEKKGETHTHTHACKRAPQWSPLLCSQTFKSSFMNPLSILITFTIELLCGSLPMSCTALKLLERFHGPRSFFGSG
jgi:hypothetical protein